MKIGFLHYTTPSILGGVEAIIAEHARLLVKHGHEVVILAGRTGRATTTPHYEERICPLFDSTGEEVLAVKKELDQGVCSERFTELTKKIFARLQEESRDLDLLIAHNVCSLSKNLALTAALKKLTESKGIFPPVAAWHHDFALTSARYAQELFSGFPWSLLVPNWADVSHVVISQHRADEYQKLVGPSSPTPSIIPNGIDLQEFFGASLSAQQSLSVLNILDGDPLMLLPVRITRRKNIELALTIIAALKEHFPGIRLFVSGPLGTHNIENVDYFSELKQLRKNLSLDKEVVFAAEISSAPLTREALCVLYRYSDALLLPSLEEGFGLPLLEAAAARTPIFCSDIVPFREILGKDPGIFSLSDPPKKIADDIRARLSTLPSSKLFSRIKREYNWERIYHDLLLPLITASKKTRQCGQTKF